MIKFFKCNNDSLVIPITYNYTSEDNLNDAKEITPNSVEAATENIFPLSHVVEVL